MGLNDATMVESEYLVDDQEAHFTFWRQPWGRGPRVKPIAELRVGFSGDGVAYVRLESGEMTASDVARFAWTRWLAAAVAHHEAQGDPENTDPVWEAWDASLPKRPGQKGHPPGFLEHVAHEVSEERRENPWVSPVPAIAKRRHVSESTVRGWMAKCVKAGLLPAGRVGRPPKEKD